MMSLRHLHTLLCFIHTCTCPVLYPGCGSGQFLARRLTVLLTYGRFLITKLPLKAIVEILNRSSRQHGEQKDSLCRIRMTILKLEHKPFLFLPYSQKKKKYSLFSFAFLLKHFWFFTLSLSWYAPVPLSFRFTAISYWAKCSSVNRRNVFAVKKSCQYIKQVLTCFTMCVSMLWAFNSNEKGFIYKIF